jgi:bacterial/archaeal transporter family-2 protein
MVPAYERRIAQLTHQSLARQLRVLHPCGTFFGCLWLCQPRPLTTTDGLTMMPWWAPLGGLVGAFAVVAGLLFVDRVGAGVYAGLTITANILMSLAIDKFGWFGLGVHPLSAGRIGGAALMVSGIVLISRY